MHDREGFIARIRQLRRTTAVEPTPPPRPELPADAARLDDLAARVAHLEQLVEGLQDSVHREFARQGRLIADIQAQVKPGAMGAALSKDARERGL